MKNNLSILILLGAFVIAFSSCKSLTNFSIEKRQHRGGYYVDWGNGKVKTDPAKSSTARREASDKPAAARSTTTAPSESAAKATDQSIAYIPVEKNRKNTPDRPVRNSIKVKNEPVAQQEQTVRESTEYNYSNSESYFDKKASDTPDWVYAVLCILLPPLAVFLKFGIGTEFWISVLLTLLFWIPGVIYAFIVIF